MQKTIQEQVATRMYELLPNKATKPFEQYEYEGDCIEKGARSFEPLRLAEVFEAILLHNRLPLKATLNGLNGYLILEMYVFKKDNILEQSDEFCEFVYNLIK